MKLKPLFNFLNDIKEAFIDIFRYIKGIFSKPKVEEKKEEKKAEYWVPLDERTIQYLPQWAREEISQLRAYAKHLEEEIERLKKENEELKKIIKAEEYKRLKEYEEILKLYTQRNRVIFLIKGKNKIRVRTYEGIRPIVKIQTEDGEHHDFVDEVIGFVLEESDYGPYLSLLCRTSMYKKYVLIPIGTLDQLPYMIKNYDTLVIDLLERGIIQIMRDANGRLVPYAISYRTQSGNSGDSGNSGSNDNSSENILVLKNYEHIFKQYPELRDLIVDMYNKIQQLTYENSKLREEIENLKQENMELQATNAALQKHIKINRAHTLNAIAQLAENYKAVMDVMSTNLQLQQRVAILESGYEDLILRAEELIRKYNEAVTRLPEEQKKIMKEAVKEAIKEEELPMDIIELGAKKFEEKSKEE